MDDITNVKGRFNPPPRLRTCTRCGRLRPVSEFSGTRRDCKDCAAALFVFCGCGCGARLKEKEMAIYSVRQDPRGYPGRGTYYINQKHKDKADGVVRDRNGIIKN